MRSGRHVRGIPGEKEICMNFLRWAGIVVAALIVLPFLTLFILSHRANAGVTHTETEIAAEPEQVWPWLDESARLKQWVSWLVEVREPQPVHHEVGAPMTWVMKDENNGGILMPLAGRFTEYNPPVHFKLGIGSPREMFEGEEAYTLVRLGSGHTRMAIDARYRYHQWFAALMEPIITPAADKKMRADLAHLKSLIETHAEAQ
jgi:uncharacterized protein YndB with AHSA1/START domain